MSNKELELENCECVLRLLAEGHGLRVVSEVNGISLDGRAPRQASGEIFCGKRLISLYMILVA